jgi:hypothetical protein
MADASRFPLETRCRLSRSILWRLQRRFYERHGMAAWGDGVLPHHASSNPYLARAYGRVVLGFLRDWHELLDPSQPLYIVELGAGSGRLAFHFLRHFERLIAGSAFRSVAFRYVMTDFAENNLAAWRAHPSLGPWIDAGRLDFARFDAERDEPIALERSGATLSPGAVRNPVVAIANYVFDSLPVDGFSLENGQLAEWVVRLCSPRPDSDLDDPDLLARAKLTIERSALESAVYYGNAAFDQILEDYRSRLSDTAFTFPTASLACLSRLSELADGRLLVLSTDKGDAREEALRGQVGPNLTLHGSCFSIAVNYDALARFVGHAGGEALVSAERPHAVTSCAFLLGAPPGGYVETRQAHAEALDAQTPDDWCSLTQSMELAYETLSLDRWIAYLRFTEHDPKILADALPFLLPLVGGASAAERAALVRVLVRTWDGYFHIGEAEDLGSALGTLASTMEAWPEAICFFEGSLRWYGRNPSTLVDLARCHHQLGQLAIARAFVDEAVAIDPACEPAIAQRLGIAANRPP